MLLSGIAFLIGSFFPERKPKPPRFSSVDEFLNYLEENEAIACDDLSPEENAIARAAVRIRRAAIRPGTWADDDWYILPNERHIWLGR